MCSAHLMVISGQPLFTTLLATWQTKQWLKQKHNVPDSDKKIPNCLWKDHSKPILDCYKFCTRSEFQWLDRFSGLTLTGDGRSKQPHIGICKIFFTYSRWQQHDVGSSCFSPSSPPSPPASCCWRTLPSPSCPAPAPPPLLVFSSRCFFVSISTTTRTSTLTSTSTSSPPSRPFFSSSPPLQSPPEGRTWAGGVRRQFSKKENKTFLTGEATFAWF